MTDDLASKSLLLSAGIVLIAAFLGLWQWYEWRARESSLPDVDRRYFARQDRRRGLGVAVIVVLALGLSVGARIAPLSGRRANVAFVTIWLAILALLAFLVALALLDWLETRRYARRQRRSMAQARSQMLRETLRESARRQPDGASKPEERGP
jgi:hypothetical protein